MSFLPIILTIIHVIVSIFLILVVLLQQGKSADWAGAFGGGGSQASFGARGSATILSKATIVAAIAFLLTSMSLTILISRPGGASVIREGAAAPQQQQQPAQQPPAAPPQTAPAEQQNQAAPPAGQP
jgi:preprotein translocase subunit SecG